MVLVTASGEGAVSALLPAYHRAQLKRCPAPHLDALAHLPGVGHRPLCFLPPGRLSPA